jgi:hypothetical protein
VPDHADDRMLERLAQALSPPAVEPSEAELRRLRRAVSNLRRSHRAEGHAPPERSPAPPEAPVVALPPPIDRPPSPVPTATSDPGAAELSLLP